MIDNAGGGIFDFLPVSTQGDDYAEHVLTPTGLEVERAAALFDARYVAIGDLAHLRDALASPRGARRSCTSGPSGRRTSRCTGAAGRPWPRALTG